MIRSRKSFLQPWITLYATFLNDRQALSALNRYGLMAGRYKTAGSSLPNPSSLLLQRQICRPHEIIRIYLQGVYPGYLNCCLYRPTLIYSMGFYRRMWRSCFQYPKQLPTGFWTPFNPCQSPLSTIFVLSRHGGSFYGGFSNGHWGYFIARSNNSFKTHQRRRWIDCLFRIS